MTDILILDYQYDYMTINKIFEKKDFGLCVIAYTRTKYAVVAYLKYSKIGHGDGAIIEEVKYRLTL